MAWRTKVTAPRGCSNSRSNEASSTYPCVDDFTYSDDNAINIKMKQGAKARWMTTYSGGIGLRVMEDCGILKPLPCA